MFSFQTQRLQPSIKTYGVLVAIIRPLHESVKLSEPGESTESSTSLDELPHFLHYSTFSN